MKGYLPQCVVYAENKLDIQIVLKLVNIHKCPLTIRAAGSGKSGGAVPERWNSVVVGEIKSDFRDR